MPNSLLDASLLFAEADDSKPKYTPVPAPAAMPMHRVAATAAAHSG